MALGDRRYMSQTQTQAGVAQYDEGLRKYLLGVYNYMTVAMGITGLVAYFDLHSADLMATIYGTPQQWVVMLAPFGFVMVLSFRVHKMSASGARSEAHTSGLQSIMRTTYDVESSTTIQPE